MAVDQPATLPIALPHPGQLRATTGHPSIEIDDRSAFRRAFDDGKGAGFAMIPIGLAFGVLVTQSGLDWWWATIFASVIYAGSLEFLLVGMVAVAAPLSHIAVTSLLVNVRHVFYALSFPLHRVNRGAARAYSTFAMTDEAYAITTSTQPERFTSAHIIWLQVIMHVLWIAGATGGALIGSALPEQIPGVGFALTALFVVLALEAFLAKRDMPTPIIALLSGAAALLISPEHMLVIGICIFTVITLLVFTLKRADRRSA